MILIAEDDLMVLKLTSRILEKAGYTVLTARNGDEAIELYKVNRDKIDLLLLDVVMPLKGGKDVADYVAASNPEIPVIFTSGYNENAIHKNFVLNDEIILIQKPFARENLLETVRTVLDKHKP